MKPLVPLLVALLAACGDSSSPPEGLPVGAAETPPASVTPSPEPPLPDGPSLRLEMEPRDGSVHVRVLARRLPALFGLAYQVRFDPAALRLESHQQALFLGELDVARYLAAPRPGALLLGGTRRTRAVGEATLAEEVEVATLRFAGTDPVSLALTRVAARRVDGTYVAVAP